MPHPSVTAVVCLLLAALPASAGDEAVENVPSKELGLVSLKAMTQKGRPYLQVSVPTNAPDGSVIVLELHDDASRRVVFVRATVQKGKLREALPLPKVRAGFFQVVVAYTAREQPRWLKGPTKPVFRRVPYHRGTPAEASSERNLAAERLRALGRTTSALARGLEKRFRRRVGRADLVDWLEQYGPKLVEPVKSALRGGHDASAGPLIAAARASLLRCDVDVRTACKAAGIRPPPELLRANASTSREAPLSHADLVLQVMLARERLKLGALEREPSRATLMRIANRARWLSVAGRAADDVGPESACRWALEDLRLQLLRAHAPMALLPKTRREAAAFEEWAKQLVTWTTAPRKRLASEGVAARFLSLRQASLAVEIARRAALARQAKKRLLEFRSELREARQDAVLRRDLALRLSVHGQLFRGHGDCLAWLRAALEAEAEPSATAERRWKELLAKL